MDGMDGMDGADLVVMDAFGINVVHGLPIVHGGREDIKLRRKCGGFGEIKGEIKGQTTN